MKKELRKKYLKIRLAIKSRTQKNKIISFKVLNHPLAQKADTILCYVSQKEEVDTHFLINTLLKTKKVAVPKVENGQMNFYYINSFADLKPGFKNILEPTTQKKVTNFHNCLCLVPGICFNHNGYRIGYGGGYYDKFLAQHEMDRLGLCYSKCLTDFAPEAHDIAVNEVICDK